MDIQKIKNTDFRQLKSCILAKIKGKTQDISDTVLKTAYLAIIKYENVHELCIPYDKIPSVCFKTVSELKNDYDFERFSSLLLFDEFDSSAPAGVTELLLRLTEENSKTKTANIMCGDISMARDVMLLENDFSNTDIFDIEISDTAKMRADVLNRFFGADIRCYSGNDFRNIHIKYDRIFSNYLLSDRPYARLEPNFTETAECLPFAVSNISYEWSIHLKIMLMLSDKGKASVITTIGAVSNKNEENIRRYFIEKGFIEKVIALPPRIFGYTPIRTAIIVFSHSNYETEFINAEDIFTYGRRINTISAENISEITDTAEKIKISKNDKKFIDNNFSLDPKKYFADKPKIKNAVPFSTVIKSVFRGVQLNAEDLDELETSDFSMYRYLRISDIQNGMINDELPYLSSFYGDTEKYCTSYGDMIISKTGKPAKTAVAGYGDEYIVITGNMYIIKLDREKIDPYFLQSYFMSETGTEELKRISGGSTLQTISLSALKNMLIPLPDMEYQRSISEKFMQKLDEIKELRKNLVHSEKELKNIYR